MASSHLLDGLTTEVNLVIEASYPVSLEPLQAAAAKCNLASLQNWTDSHPDLVYPLTQAVLESLHSQPHALPLLVSLCAEISFRDQVLRHYPSTLYDILTRATTSEHGFRRFAKAAIALLRYPLPSCCPLPEPAHAFFTRLLDDLIAQPSRSLLEASVTLADGACKHLLATLDQAKLDAIRRAMDTLLARTSGSQGLREHLLAVYALHILQRLEHYYVEPCLPSTADPGLSSQMSVLSMSDYSREHITRYFDGVDAETTAHICCVLTVYACSTDRVSNEQEASRTIQLARRVILRVDPHISSNWASQNHIITSKIHEKIVLHHSKAVQLEGLAFMTAFRDVKTSNASSRERFKNYLLGLKHVTQPSPEALVQALRFYSHQSHQLNWQALLKLMLDEQLAKPVIGSLTAVLSELDAMAKQDASIRAVFVKAVMAMQCQVNTFLDGLVVMQSEARKHYDSRLVLFLSNCFILSPTDQSHREISLKLLEKQALLSSLAAKPSARALARQTVASPSLQSPSDTQNGGASLTWRERVALAFKGSAGISHDEVSRLVESICRDLQDRCDAVEEPLQQARSDLKDLEAQFQSTSEAHDHLQAEIEAVRKQRQEEEAAAKHTQESLEQDLAAQQSECTRLFDRNKQLVEKLTRCQDDLDEDAVMIKELERKVRSMEHSNVAQKERIESLEQAVSAREQCLDSLRREVTFVTRLTEDTAAERAQEQEAHETALQAAETKRIGLRNVIHELQSRLEETESAYQSTVKAHDSALALAKSELDSAKEENGKLRGELTTVQKQSYDTRSALEQAQGELSIARNQHDSIEREYVAHREEASQQARVVAERMAEVEQQLWEMTRRCNEKQLELDQAQAMRSNMMKLMGVEMASACAQGGPTGRREGASHVPNTASRRRARQYRDVPSSGLELERKLSSAQAQQQSSSPTGSTPKRQKQRRGFKVPLLKTCDGDGAVARGSPRRALQDLTSSRLNVRMPRTGLESFRQPISPLKALGTRRQPVTVTPDPQNDMWEDDVEVDSSSDELEQAPLRVGDQPSGFSQLSDDMMSELEDEEFEATMQEL